MSNWMTLVITVWHLKLEESEAERDVIKNKTVKNWQKMSVKIRFPLDTIAFAAVDGGACLKCEIKGL